MQHEEAKANYEKLKGRFKLKINHNLPMNKKIETYANEKIAFHLHKNRNFLHKIKTSMLERDRDRHLREELEREMKFIEKLKLQQKQEYDIEASININDDDTINADNDLNGNNERIDS